MSLAYLEGRGLLVQADPHALLAAWRKGAALGQGQQVYRGALDGLQGLGAVAVQTGQAAQQALDRKSVV